MREKKNFIRTASIRCSTKRQLTKIFILLFSLCTFSALAENIYSQQKELSVRLANTTIGEAFSYIEKNSDYVFLIADDAATSLNHSTHLVAENSSIQQIMDMLLKNTDLAYRVVERQVSVYKKKSITRTMQKEIMQQQPIVLKGKVTDNLGEALPGVSIFTKDRRYGVSTDLNGRFSLPINNANDSIYFTFVGFKKHRILAKEGINKELKIILYPNIVEMQQLVVVAYGTTDRKTYTGSVASLSADDIQRNKSNNVLTSLQGIVPGLQLENKSLGNGQSMPDIVIRGASSINSSIKPLYIIDGVPGDALGLLNPEDIASISILKDAAAISLYGARATNGVILISTKQGRKAKNQKATISYSGQFGISTRTGKDYKMVSPKDYYELSWEALRNGADDNPGLLTAGGKNYSSSAEYATGELLNTFGYNAYDKDQPVGINGQLDPTARLLWWEDYGRELIKTGSRNEHSININDATDRMKYYLSASYLNQKGLEPGNSGFDRFTVRTNLSYAVNKFLQIGVNIGMTHSESKTNSINNGYSDFATYARLTPGLYPLYKRDENGNPMYDENGNSLLDFGNGPSNILNSRRPDVTSEDGGINPLGTLDLDKSGSKRRYYFSNFFAEIDLKNGLKFRTTYAYNVADTKSKNYRNRTLGGSKDKGLLSVNTSQMGNWTANGILSYHKSWSSDHRIRLLAGTEINESSFSSVNASVTGFAFEGMDELINGATILKPSIGLGTSSKERLVGFFSRAEYDLLNRYFFSASLRRDGSSNFHPDSRWGNFWSVGASWLLSSEEFIRNIKWISNLKVRTSYGTSGNIGKHDYRSYYSMGYTFMESPGVYISSLANKSLKWEINKQFNIGLDASLFNNRIQLTCDWYNRITDDLFYNTPLSPSIGFKNVLRNIGSLRNKGIEFSITTENIKNKNFEWSTSFNIANNKNEILALNQDEFVTGNRIYKIGQSTTEFFIREYAGVNSENGKPQWYIDEISTKTGERTGQRIKTENWSETIIKTVTLDDGSTKTFRNLGRYSVGNYTPTISGGFYNSFRFGNVDLGILFNYSLGAKILMADYAPLTNSGSNTIKLFHKDMLNRWQKKDDITNIPRLTTSKVNNYTGSFAYTSTFYMRKGDYLKLKTVSLGYNFPQKVAHKLHLSSARIYLQGDNICYFSAERGFDPEQVQGGVVTSNFPALSTYSLGVKLTF